MRPNKDIVSTVSLLYSLYQFTVMMYSDINIILVSRSRPCPFIFFGCSCVCISVSAACARFLTRFISLISTLGMYSCMTRKTNEEGCCGYYVVLLRATVVHICPIYSMPLRRIDERTVVEDGQWIFLLRERREPVLYCLLVLSLAVHVICPLFNSL